VNAVRRLLTVLGTLAWTQGAEVILTRAPTGALIALVEIPAAIGMAAAATNIRRALR